MVMTKLPEGAPNIATGKVKWDIEYQKKIGLVTQPAKLEPKAKKDFEQLSKRIYGSSG
jgi:hypothetical protein